MLMGQGRNHALICFQQWIWYHKFNISYISNRTVVWLTTKVLKELFAPTTLVQKRQLQLSFFFFLSAQHWPSHLKLNLQEAAELWSCTSWQEVPVLLQQTGFSPATTPSFGESQAEILTNWSTYCLEIRCSLGGQGHTASPLAPPES